MDGVRKKGSAVRGTWKAFERLVAKSFGTERTALSGGNSKVTRSDTLHDVLYVECKYGKRVAPWSLFKDAAAKATVEGKVPVLCLKQKGETGFLVVCLASDLRNVSDYLFVKEENQDVII